MNELISITTSDNGIPVVSSREVAEHFGKQHKDVLRAVDTLKEDVRNFAQMFFETEIPDSYNRPQRTYNMTRDGFTLLAMGFTGKDALAWKLKYIQAFNDMEQQLHPKAKLETTPEKKAIAEAKLNNSRARLASMWLKVGTLTTPEYKQVCASYASTALSGGKEVIALPEAREKFYTATEVGAVFGVSSQRIGILSSDHKMKTDEYGKWFFDKSRYSAKQVQTFKYNDKGVEAFRLVLNREVG